MTTASISSHYGCMVCRKNLQLNTCGKCKVVQYCSKDHQVADWPDHKVVCKKIGRALAELEAEQQEEAMFNEFARTMSGTLPDGFDVGILLKVATTELEVDTRLAIESGLGHVLEMTKYAKSAMLGIADLAPACYLRLGRDQEAYDFMKWWITTPDTLMSAPRPPYTAIKDADVLEAATIFEESCPSLAFMATLTLLKLRLLMDLQALQRSKEAVSTKLPQELLDEIRKKMVSSAITRQLIERDDHQNDITKLVGDVKKLYGAVKSANNHFWPGVLHPVDDLKVKVDGWNYGNKQEMQLALQHTYKAWAETPGAIEAIEALSIGY